MMSLNKGVSPLAPSPWLKVIIRCLDKGKAVKMGSGSGGGRRWPPNSARISEFIQAIIEVNVTITVNFATVTELEEAGVLLVTRCCCFLVNRIAKGLPRHVSAPLAQSTASWAWN